MPRKRGSGHGASRPNKYRARKTLIDNILFDSNLEAMCWLALKDRLDKGHIYALERQVEFRCDINGIHVCSYFADFQYRLTTTGELVVADAKGFLTDIYRIKKKLVRAIFAIDILELPEKVSPQAGTKLGPVKRRRGKK